MGVCGFTKYIDKNSYLLNDYKLRNTKLVIDGNNFYHFIYYHYNVSHVYSGDYNQFTIICRSFFEYLIACNVTPFVIFDGAYDLTNVKFKSAITRAGKKMWNAHSTSQGDFKRVLPLLAPEVFVQVLNDLNIKHATCNFEADNQISSLAFSYNCPVLTNDSDFFVTNLSAGVLLLDYLEVELKMDSDASHYMKAQLFKISNLVNQLRLPDPLCVALFATILGNDIVDKSIFNFFVDRFIKMDVRSSEKNHFKKIKGLFNWLSKKKNLDVAVTDLVLECPLEKRDKIQALVKFSLDTYSIKSTYLIAFFKNKYTESEIDLNSEEEMVNNMGKKCPEWLQSRLNRGYISARVLNLWMAGKLVLQPQVGSRCFHSSHLPSRNIRKLIHTILSDRPEFQEYVRKDGKLSRQNIKSDYEFHMVDKAPSIENIAGMNKEYLLNIYLEAFPNDQTCFLEYPDHNKLIISIILYWLLACKPSKSELLSLLLALFLPAVLKHIFHFKNEAKEELETKVSLHIDCSKKYKKYFNPQAIHSLTQFQSCLQWLLDLNALLDHPFPHFRISFNASSFIVIHHYLQNYNGTLDNYFEKVSSTLNSTEDCVFVSKLYKRFEKHATLDSTPSLKQSQNILNKTSMKKRKNKSSKSLKTCPDDDEEKDDEEVEKEIEDFYDVENKFSCLQILST